MVEFLGGLKATRSATLCGPTASGICTAFPRLPARATQRFKRGNLSDFEPVALKAREFVSLVEINPGLP